MDPIASPVLDVSDVPLSDLLEEPAAASGLSFNSSI